MMMKKWTLTTLMIFAVIAGLTGTACAFGIEAAIGGWYQTPSGHLGYKALDSGDFLDLENDLNYGDEKRVTARVNIDMPLIFPNIYLMASPMEFTETGQKTGGFTFGDINFDPGTFVSKMSLDNYDIGLYYGIPLLKTATLKKLNVDVGINVRLIDYDLSIHQDSTGLDESESGVLPIPMVFLAVQFTPFKALSFQAEGRAISYSGNDLISLIGRIKVKIFGPVFAAAGYRYEKINIDEEDVDASLEVRGPFLEAGLSF
ncbi:TIGR04219 family outer membrane beta-barrel protein [uncultured Desulfobacter sp.]|uniref:TIGR04219 family outer membrane beta-barrel protein n=1 Tax=uncultured Desulfobacter sp. TaxID=240139 RepID=UPI002AABB5C9|nr:TIGR04219 family outer membrane beta-barrel protein [uncultured Desulfobacter sp.]